MRYFLAGLIAFLLAIEINAQVGSKVKDIVFLPATDLYDTVGFRYYEPQTVIRRTQWNNSWLIDRGYSTRTVLSDSSYIDSSFNKKGVLNWVIYQYYNWDMSLYFDDEGRPSHFSELIILRDSLDSTKYDWQTLNQELIFRNGQLMRKLVHSKGGVLEKDIYYDSGVIIKEEFYTTMRNGFRYVGVSENFKNGKPRRTYILEHGKLIDTMIFYDPEGKEIARFRSHLNMLMEFKHKDLGEDFKSWENADFSFKYYDAKGELVNTCTLKGRKISFSPSKTEEPSRPELYFKEKQ